MSKMVKKCGKNNNNKLYKLFKLNKYDIIGRKTMIVNDVEKIISITHVSKFENL